MKRILLIIILCISLFACQKKEVVDDEKTIYFLNNNPYEHDLWLEIAQKYYESNKVLVKVVSPEEGTYNSTLINELSNYHGISIFKLHDIEDAETFAGFAANLEYIDIYDELITHDFELLYNDRVVGLGYNFQSFGIIVNKELLNIAGYEIDDLKDYESFKKIVEDVHERYEELNFDSFINYNFTLSSSSSFDYLINNMIMHEINNLDKDVNELKGKYLDNLKTFIDLFIENADNSFNDNNDFTYEDMKLEFVNKKALFYLGNSDEYQFLIDSGLSKDNLYMIPIFMDIEEEEDYGLILSAKDYLSINLQLEYDDFIITSDFINWLLKSDECAKIMNDRLSFTQTSNKNNSVNVFLNQSLDYIQNNKRNIKYEFEEITQYELWRKDLYNKLNEYMHKQDANSWAEVADVITINLSKCKIK